MKEQFLTGYHVICTQAKKVFKPVGFAYQVCNNHKLSLELVGLFPRHTIG